MSKEILDEAEFTIPASSLTIRTTGNTDKIILSLEMTSEMAAALVYLAQGTGNLEVKIKAEEV